MEPLYPAYLDLSGRPVLVVGGGDVAARKVRRLLECGARVTVVSPEISTKLQQMAKNEDLDLLRRAYRSEDMDGRWLVVAATDEEEINRTVSSDAEKEGIFCNVVDVPDLCSFQVPAVVRRGLLQLAISTGGASPALARRLRIELEDQFRPAYAHLLEALAELREHVQAKYPDRPKRRRELLESFLDSSAPALLLEKRDREAFQREVERWKTR